MMMFVVPMIVFIAGSLMGGLLLFAADCLIIRKERVEIPVRNDRIYFAKLMSAEEARKQGSRLHSLFQSISNSLKTSIFQTVSMILLNGAGWLCTVLIMGFNIRAVEIMVVISAALVISVIDIKIHIIPNELVLLMLASFLVFFFTGAMSQSILLHLLGLAIALALFSLPILLKNHIGAGDIKYIAVMGFCLGYPDIFKAVIILSGILFAWMIFITITKRAALKMKFALGPFISIGFVATLLLPQWG